MAATESRWHRIVEKGLEELRRYLVMFLYLWVVFASFVLDEAVILGPRNISYVSQGFAIINAAVLAKIMLVAEDLKIGRRFEHLPLIYPVIYKSCAFAVVFIVFHIVEKTVLGVLGGHSLAASMPAIGGGSWHGILTVWALMSIALLPFFALRELGRYLGNGRLWAIMFKGEAVPPTAKAEAR